jgi:hypothetical protein
MGGVGLSKDLKINKWDASARHPYLEGRIREKGCALAGDRYG